MFLVNQLMLSLMFLLMLANPGRAAQSSSDHAAVSQHKFQQYIAKLTKDPADTALRERIIVLALGMDPAPLVPEIAERHMARGAALTRNAAGAGDYKRAIVEFESAINKAPWVARGYFSLAMAQEKVGLYAEAVKNFTFYLLAAPDALNTATVKNKIYEIEADLERLKVGKNTVTHPAGPLPDTTPIIVDKNTGTRDTVQLQSDISTRSLEKTGLPNAKKTKAFRFVGNWYFKDTIRGQERTIKAFGIHRDASGDIVPLAPERLYGYVPAIRAFEIVDDTLTLEIHWRLSTVVGYWKIEKYTLTLSEDGAKLNGSYVEKSVGGRTIRLDRALFRH
jgi:tetratricopeptide (TPR) repeat protein